eukprot:2034373-Pyramimonas_sp.AAC.1
MSVCVCISAQAGVGGDSSGGVGGRGGRGAHGLLVVQRSGLARLPAARAPVPHNTAPATGRARRDWPSLRVYALLPAAIGPRS